MKQLHVVKIFALLEAGNQTYELHYITALGT